LACGYCRFSTDVEILFRASELKADVTGFKLSPTDEKIALYGAILPELPGALAAIPTP
jgi:hypothetical protein